MKKILVLAVSLVFLLSASTFAQNSDAKIAMDIETTYSAGYDSTNYVTSVGASTDIYISLYIKDVNDLNGYDLRFTFDSSKVDYVTAATSTMSENNILTSGGTYQETKKLDDNNLERFIMAASLPTGSSVSSSTWSFAGYIKFTTKSGFTTSDIAHFVFDYAEFTDSSNPATVQYAQLGNEQNAALNTTSTQSSTTLPVELVDFTAEAGNNFVTLNWTTASELNNFGFEVEKSTDGVNFEKIGFVPGNGTTDNEITYTYTDEGLSAGKFYYRLKQVDYDGNFEYSGVVTAVVEVPSSFNLNQNYPNPANPTTTISFDIKEKGHVELIVTNVLGQVVKTLVSREMTAGKHEVQFNAKGLASGIYFYTLKSGNMISTKKLTVLK